MINTGTSMSSIFIAVTLVLYWSYINTLNIDINMILIMNQDETFCQFYSFVVNKSFLSVIVDMMMVSNNRSSSKKCFFFKSIK